MEERTRKGLHISPVDSAELSYKTKLALIDFIRGYETDQPFKLPSEDQLAQRLGVSRNALRDVLASLEEMGLVTRQRSKGTLANPKVARECRMDTDPGLIRMITRMGCQPRYEVTSLRFVEDKDSGLEQNSDSYLEVGKLFYADDTPVAFANDHVEGKIAAGHREQFEVLREENCFFFLKECCGVSVAYSMSTFDVMQADEVLQKLFHVGPEELFLVMDDIVYSRDLEIVCHAVSYYRKGYLPLKVLRKGW